MEECTGNLIAMNLLWISDTELPAATRDELTLEGGAVIAARGGADGLALFGESHIDAVVVRAPLDGWTAQEIVDEVHRKNALAPVIVIEDAEVSSGEIRAALAQRRTCAAAISNEPWRRFLVGDSAAMQTIWQVVRLVGPRKCTVLLTGETGTGKEMVARAIHMAGSRSQSPMVAVNCSALPDQLLEAELFGHVKGAFTGAVGHRIGRFEQANHGTLFLDEIGDMPIELQAKLLRVLQERELQRVGSSDTVRLDVRFIAASNADLARAVNDGEFREDLYYRLNVVPLRMPALRERTEDIPLLIEHFIEKVCRSEDLPIKRIARPAVDYLMDYDWPGNVRQLENAVETAVVLSGERSQLLASDFCLPAVRRMRPAALQLASSVSVPDHGLDFERTVGRFEREILEQALRKTNGNKKRAAEMLRLKRTTLAAKLKSLEAMAC
jgi:DNA-binding NtrC family response regulator